MSRPTVISKSRSSSRPASSLAILAGTSYRPVAEPRSPMPSAPVISAIAGTGSTNARRWSLPKNTTSSGANAATRAAASVTPARNACPNSPAWSRSIPGVCDAHTTILAEVIRAPSAEHERVAGAAGQLDPHRLVSEVLMQSLGAVPPPEPGRLHAAERHREVQRPVRVHPDGADPEPLRHPERALDVPGPDCGRGPVARVVGDRDSLVLGAELEQGEHRPEDFLLADRRVVGDVGDDRRGVEQAA